LISVGVKTYMSIFFVDLFPVTYSMGYSKENNSALSHDGNPFHATFTVVGFSVVFKL